MNFENSKEYASHLDSKDPLAYCRDLFFYPHIQGVKNTIYLCGNSLGLQPKSVKYFLEKELELWSNRGVLGQHERWEKFHEDLAYPTSKLIGSKHSEVVIMNGLTVNLHLLLISLIHKQGCSALLQSLPLSQSQQSIQPLLALGL